MVCQSGTILLARLYFVKGGTSKWLSIISQLGGFPILIPYYVYTKLAISKQEHHHHDQHRHHPLTYGSFYVFQGVLLGGSTYIYTIGLQYLPVSTSSLIASSQLAFNAFFSYFMNSQKFTPYITNSLFLLTVSSVLLVFSGDTNGPSSVESKGKYTLGFVCSLASASGFGLYLSVAEYAFSKLRNSFRTVMNMLLFQGMVATGLGIIGLFASGEWKGLRKEMEDDYELGKVSYVMTLAWTGLSWQVFIVATMSLVFQVSSVFSNAVATFGLPLTPILAVAIFHDKMSGVKAIAMLLALWGFLSYLYQQYLDDARRDVSTSVDVNEGLPLADLG
ncbi:Purine permease 21 [Linum grandiflorum]